jgi:hypothetical protein
VRGHPCDDSTGENMAASEKLGRLSPYRFRSYDSYYVMMKIMMMMMMMMMMKMKMKMKRTFTQAGKIIFY